MLGTDRYIDWLEAPAEDRPSVVIDPRWIELVKRHKDSPMRLIWTIKTHWPKVFEFEDIESKLKLIIALKDLKRLEEFEKDNWLSEK